MKARHTRLILVALILGSAAATAAAQDCMGWSDPNPVDRPPAREGAALAYDSARGVTVMFGGWMSEFYGPFQMYGDTWEWDGVNWTLRSTGGPSPRCAHKMVYDSARGVTVLFGGVFSPDGLNTWFDYQDTWEWNGVEWTQRATDGPDRRFGHYMAYDSARNVTVLFGGYNLEYETYLNATWEWDGTDWALQYPTGDLPEPRYGGGMAYDPGLGVCVLMGGGSGGGHDPIARHYDIWHWDGEAWHDQGNHLQNDQHTKGPVAHDEIRQRTWMLTNGSYGRWNMEGWNGTDLVGVFWTLGYTDQAADAAMAYDSDRGVCVVFGRGWTDQTLEFGSDLRITQQPLDQVVAPGDALTLTVTATGTGPIYYAWHKDGEALVDDGRITGSTTATLTIDPVEPGDAGSYHVVVRSDCGPIDSELATIITCVGDVNGDGSIGQPDLGILLANYDTTDATYQDGDLDLDGDVDQADLGLLLAVYDTDCP